VNRSSAILVAAVFCSVCGCKNPVDETPKTVTTIPPQYEHYALVWNDEFDGSALDPAKWNIETGTGVNGDFGTGQLDRATNRTENISVVPNISGAQGGCLAITVRKERYIDRDYTSGRINTSGKGAWGPGHRIEARIRATGVKAKGQGFAFWMMPAERPSEVAGLMWPQGGEVDIMEFVGTFPFHNLGTVHYAWSWNNNEYADWNHGHKGAYYTFSTGDVPVNTPAYSGYIPPAEDTTAGNGCFRTYAVEWFADRMEFSVDANVYHIHYFNDGAALDHGISDGQDEQGVVTVGGKRRMLTEYSNHFAEWHPFEHSFYIILSAGVGGNDAKTYGGAVVPEAPFPCSVHVDWVRVYKRNN
jgi:beta-glucanase (GH16 family)